MPAFMQNDFINRGQTFAAKNNVYLLMAMAVFEPGKITPDRNFLENKTVLVSPEGEILNVFHKNYPVPFAEHSVPGDGKIPVVKTPYGNLSVSICYDADIAMSMEQLGKNKSDVLFLPSGDWYDIAPYHSYMATFRGIENGCSIVRQASGGLSLATDYRGKTQTSFDFYNNGEKLWVSDITIGHVNTIYSVIGDVIGYASVIITAASLIYLLIQFILERKNKKAQKKVLEPAI
jgi:apolipoprotein N-acyltransferase